MESLPRPPVFLDRVLDDPDLVRVLAERGAPYHPVQRYFNSEAEYAALAGSTADARPAFVGPVFRGDWAYDRVLLPGAGALLEHEGFAEAARRLFDGGVVRPQIVYSNLTWQLPFDQGKGHTDIPAFRGVDRTRVPIWLLAVMGHSGLFEAERIRIATAVAWFYEGDDGGFVCWPDGPDARPRVHEGAIHNTAFVGDNDRMFHHVRPVGRREDGLPTGLTLDSRLEHVGGERWRVMEAGRELGAFAWSVLRISVSWKAQVFRDEDERRRVDEHREDLALGEVFARFERDLRARGVLFEPPRDPLADPAFVRVLARTYVREPTVRAA